MCAGQPLDLAQINAGRLFALAAFGQKPLAGIDIPAHAAQLGSAGNTDHPRIRRTDRKLPCQEPPLNLVHADHRMIRPALGEQPPLGREIPALAPVPVQMIGRQVGEHRHIGRQGAGQFGLIA